MWTGQLGTNFRESFLIPLAVVVAVLTDSQKFKLQSECAGRRRVEGKWKEALGLSGSDWVMDSVTKEDHIVFNSAAKEISLK